MFTINHIYLKASLLDFIISILVEQHFGIKRLFLNFQKILKFSWYKFGRLLTYFEIKTSLKMTTKR